ncbi:MAG: T9SS type A sorting domain-containing protein [Candidatus Hatepunaea meridiana]|nr:T9SS type A sorting domain-containing protein [Candidatus Hatepunaea meridiana]
MMKKYYFLSLLVILTFNIVVTSISAQESNKVDCVKRMYYSWNIPVDMTGKEDVVFFITRSYGNRSVFCELVGMDISNPETPQEVCIEILPITETFPKRIRCMGNNLFISSGEGLIVYNIEDTQHPAMISVYRDIGDIYGLAVHDNYAYVGTSDNTLVILDVSDPSSPREIGSCQIGFQASDIKVEGQYVYLAGYHFVAVDISEINDPRQVGRINLTAGNFEISGDYAYLATGVNGVRIIDISRSNDLREVGHYRMNAYNLAIWEDRLYVSYINFEDEFGYDRAHLVLLDISNPIIPRLIRYIYIGFSYGINIVELYEDRLFIGTNPNGGNRFRILGNLDSPVAIGGISPSHSVNSLAIRDNHLYVRLRDHAKLLNIFNRYMLYEESMIERRYGSIVKLSNNEDYIYLNYSLGGPMIYDHLKICNIHNRQRPIWAGTYRFPREHIIDYIAIDNEEYAYVTTHYDDNHRLTIINLSDPENPSEVVHFETDHIRSVHIFDNYAFLTFGRDGLVIWDISDRVHPEEILHFDTPGIATNLFKDLDHLYILDGDMRIYDISDLERVNEVGNFEIPGCAVDIHVEDDIAYIAALGNNETPSGLYIIDVFDPSSPEQRGYCHTYGTPRNLAVHQPYVYVAETRHLAIYDCYDALDISEQDDLMQPGNYHLFSTYPNPFNTHATISLDILQPGCVTLGIYDILGRKMQDLNSAQWMPVGQHLMQINAEGLAAGNYLLRLETVNGISTGNIVLIK